MDNPTTCWKYQNLQNNKPGFSLIINEHILQQSGSAFWSKKFNQTMCEMCVMAAKILAIFFCTSNIYRCRQEISKLECTALSKVFQKWHEEKLHCRLIRIVQGYTVGVSILGRYVYRYHRLQPLALYYNNIFHKTTAIHSAQHSLQFILQCLALYFIYLLSRTHLSVGLQNGVTHGIFSAGEDSRQVLASRDEGSSA